MPRRDPPSSPRRLRARRREREALTYRLGGMKLWEIAEKLGVSEAAVSKMLKKILQSTADDISEKAAELRAVQLERIEMMIRGLWSEAINGSDKAVLTITRLLERQARLLGIDNPVHAEMPQEGQVFVWGGIAKEEPE